MNPRKDLLWSRCCCNISRVKVALLIHQNRGVLLYYKEIGRFPLLSVGSGHFSGCSLLREMAEESYVSSREIFYPQNPRRST